jgi:hypothetical protein
MYTSFGQVLYCFLDIVCGEINSSCCIDNKICIEADVPGIYGAEINTVISGKAAEIKLLYL